MLMSPNIARLADTPPVVGSVMTEMKGSRASDKRLSAALVFAICSSEYSASCIRAPPLAEKHTNGKRCSRHTSTARTNLFTDHRAHGSTEKAKLEAAGHNLEAGNLARHADHRISFA